MDNVKANNLSNGKHNGKVAVPYYGRLCRAKIGYERIFFIVEPGEARENPDVSLGVWENQVEQSLPEWLQKNGVVSVVCKGKPENPMKDSMARLGIDILNEENNYANTLMQILMV